MPPGICASARLAIPNRSMPRGVCHLFENHFSRQTVNVVGVLDGLGHAVTFGASQRTPPCTASEVRSMSTNTDGRHPAVSMGVGRWCRRIRIAMTLLAFAGSIFHDAVHM